MIYKVGHNKVRRYKWRLPDYRGGYHDSMEIIWEVMLNFTGDRVLSRAYLN